MRSFLATCVIIKMKGIYMAELTTRQLQVSRLTLPYDPVRYPAAQRPEWSPLRPHQEPPALAPEDQERSISPNIHNASFCAITST